LPSCRWKKTNVFVMKKSYQHCTAVASLHDIRLSLWCKGDLCFSGMLHVHSVDWLDKLLIFWDKLSALDCLTLWDGTHGLSRNIGNYQCMLHNIPEEQRSSNRKLHSPLMLGNDVCCLDGLCFLTSSLPTILIPCRLRLMDIECMVSQCRCCY
jgi:hypothetical protein